MAQSQIPFRKRYPMDIRQATVQRFNFSHSFRPTYIVSRIFGLMPFSIVYYPNGDVDRPRVSIFDGLWFAVSLCLYTCGIYVASAYQIYSQPTSKMSVVLIIGFSVCSLLGLLLGYISIFSDMVNRFKLIDIVRNFTIFDQEASQIINQSHCECSFLNIWIFAELSPIQMQPMGIHNNYKREFRRGCIYYALSIITINACAALNFIFFQTYFKDTPDKIDISASVIAFDTLQISVSATIAVTLRLLLHNVSTRFAALNLLLRYSDLLCSISSFRLNSIRVHFRAYLVGYFHCRNFWMQLLQLPPIHFIINSHVWLQVVGKKLWQWNSTENLCKGCCPVSSKLLKSRFTLHLRRNHFLSGNKLNTCILSHKKELIKILKLVSRQHLFLTEIVEQINSCYSIQVDFAVFR